MDKINNISNLKKEKISIENRKQDIEQLKKCAKFYKENLLAKIFLLVYDDGEYVEISFKESDFKHLTGISSDLSAKQFYKKCIGIKKKNKKFYIMPNEIYTSDKHPRALAQKKLDVFCELMKTFTGQSFLLHKIRTDSHLFEIGVADLKLTLLCEYCTENYNFLTASSLRSSSYLKKADEWKKIDYVFVKGNPYEKYNELLFPKKIEYSYFDKNSRLSEMIEFN